MLDRLVGDEHPRSPALDFHERPARTAQAGNDHGFAARGKPRERFALCSSVQGTLDLAVSIQHHDFAATALDADRDDAAVSQGRSEAETPAPSQPGQAAARIEPVEI